MKIRKATMKDAKEILKLFNSSENLGGDSDDICETYTIKQYIKGPIFQVFVVEINGEIAGAASIEIFKTAKYSYLDNIVVSKKFIGQNIGYSLMNYLENYIKKQGSKYFFYYVEENNKIMHKLSNKLNYKRGKKFVFYSKLIK